MNEIRSYLDPGKAASNQHLSTLQRSNLAKKKQTVRRNDKMFSGAFVTGFSFVGNLTKHSVIHSG